MVTQLSLGSIEPYRNWLSVRQGFSTNTVRAYVADARQFFSEWMHSQPVPLEEMENQVGQWVGAHRREWEPRTLNRKLTSLKSIMRWAGMADPMKGFKAERPPRPIPHPLPNGNQDTLRLIAVAEKVSEKVLVALCGLVGLRISEALNVETDDFNFGARTLRVRGKGYVTRDVPVSPAAWDVIGNHVTWHWIESPGKILDYQDRTARRIISNLGRKAGLLRDISSHDLRATFATEAYRKSLDIHAVAILLGHQNVATTMTYVHSDTARLHAAADFTGEDDDD